MVGRNQLWPISIQDACIQAGYMVSTGRTGAGVALDYQLKLYPKPFLVTCLIIALACFLGWSLIAAYDSE